MGIRTGLTKSTEHPDAPEMYGGTTQRSATKTTPAGTRASYKDTVDGSQRVQVLHY